MDKNTNEYGLKRLEWIFSTWKKRKKIDIDCKIFLPKIECIEEKYYFVYPIFSVNELQQNVIIDWIYQDMLTMTLKQSFKNENDYIGVIEIDDECIDLENSCNSNIIELYSYQYKYIKKVLFNDALEINHDDLLKIIEDYKACLSQNLNEALFAIYINDDNKDDFEKETSEILKRIESIENIIEHVDYDFEWNLESGLRYVSYDVLNLCITMLEKGAFSLKKIIENDKEKIQILNEITVLCDYQNSKEEMNEKIFEEKLKNGEGLARQGTFKCFMDNYENFTCINCKFSRCPKYYAGYILYLINKGLINEALIDRKNFRIKEGKKDFFTFEWNVEDGVKKIPQKRFEYAIAMLENNMVDVEACLTEKNLIKISIPFGCGTYRQISDNIDEMLKYKDAPINKWVWVTRSKNVLLYKCTTWDCGIPYCMFDLAGYLFYCKKNGEWDKIVEDRKYYEEHKEEIEEEAIKEQEEQLKKLQKDMEAKSIRETKRILEYKNIISNVDQIVDKIGTENGLHITIECEKGNGKFTLGESIAELLYANRKIDNNTPEYISLHNLAFLNTYEKLRENGTTQWLINEYAIKERNLYIITDIKEFTDECNKMLNSNRNSDYLQTKRLHRVIELITSLYNENYIILLSDSNAIDSLLALDSKLKFVYQNNRFKVDNLPIDKLFELYYSNLNNELMTKLRNDEELKQNVKELFIEYVSINADFFPFRNEELARYLANYSISKKDFILPDNIYKKESVEESLKNIVGLEKVKENIKKFEKYALYTVKAKNLGLKMNKSNLHMIFTGNPGTGKTTVARIMAKMLYDLGLISENKLVEVERKDLVAPYIGQTAPKTAEVIERALGGVLFIDEAYTLAQGSKSGNDFGAEAVATLIKAMEDHKENLVVIFAGYKDEMKSFLDINSGIASRIGYTFDFDDYNNEELNQIFNLKLTNMGYKINKNVEKNIMKIFEYFVKRKNFGNGRFVDKLIQEVIMKHALREAKNLLEITVADIPTIEELNNTNYSDYNANEMLDKLVGMTDLKSKIKEFEKYIKFLKKAEEQDIVIPNQNLHMIFTGNPGTGKTTVARIIAKILFDMGMIHENKLIEVERKDLVAEYVGQTAIKTSEVIEKAIGGVLFIDEAYTLASGNKSGNDFGAEAIATLIKAMEDHKGEFIVILAGYKDEMRDFINVNPGISSRIGYTFDFPDYTDSEYCEIYYRKISAMGLKLNEDAKKNVETLMKYFCNVENNGNGRFVDKVVQSTLMKLANKEDDITVVSKECIPTIQEMTKNIFDGDSMINPDFINDESQKRTAVHEVGHAAIRFLLNKNPGIKKITINAEGNGTLGYVEYNTSNYKYTKSKNEYLNRICGLLGGMCNEIVYYGEHESGNSSDLDTASRIVRDMITRFGMSSLGLYTFPYEKDTEKYIYQEANKILSECYEKTINLLTENKSKTEKAVKYLLDKKEIDEEQFLKIIQS